jgi:hypothetical protein
MILLTQRSLGEALPEIQLDAKDGGAARIIIPVQWGWW